MVNRALTTDMLRRPSVDDLLADAWLSAHREEGAASRRAAVQPGFSQRMHGRDGDGQRER